MNRALPKAVAGAEPGSIVRPAILPPAGFPGLDPAWSRLVEVVGGDGLTRTFHVLDSRQRRSPADENEEPVGTLLCVHGNPTWSYLWRRLVAAPPPGWRVIAPDQLGMGYSERIGTPRVLGQRVDDLGRLTAALGVSGPVVTVAHDWGGIIAMGWAADHRDQLAGVVLTNTAVHQPESSAGPVLIRLAHVPAINRFACRWTPLFVRTTTSLTWPRLPRAVRDAFAAPYTSVGLRAAVGDFVADIPFAADHPSRPVLDRIADGMTTLDVPSLLLWGPRDPVFLEEHLRDLQQRLPTGKLHRYENASHLLPEDAPGYVDAVRAFVDGLESAPVTGRHRAADPADRIPADGAAPPSVFAQLVARAGDDTPAVVEVGGGSISWARLHRRIRDTGTGLRAAGLRPGHRVALLIPPSIDLTVALYAVWQAGGVIVVVDRGLGLRGMARALRSARIDHVLADVPGLLAAGPMRVPGTRIASRRLPAGLRRLTGATHSLPDLEAAGRGLGGPALGADSVHADDTAEAAVVFTSGATGPAKGVLYRHRQLRAQLAAISATYRLGPQDRMVAAFAPFALYGPALGVPSAVPATDVTKPGTLTAAALGDAAAALAATVVFASPAALANVLATADGVSDQQAAALGRVRLLMSAGAPVPAGLLRNLQAVLPHAAMHTPYGMTEGLPLTDISLPEIEAAGDGDGVCVGRPLPGVRLLIGPFDGNGGTGTDLTDRPCVSGEIWVGAAHLKDRYDTLWMTDQRAAAHPGWHRTGDVGMVDEQGRLWVQGRTVHVISTPDGPVTPVGVEQRVQRALRGVQPVAAGGGSADCRRRRFRTRWDATTPAGARRARWPAGVAGTGVRCPGGGRPAHRGGPGPEGAPGRHPAQLEDRPGGCCRMGRRCVVRPGTASRTGTRSVRVLVTGASGMTGRAVATALLARGDEVTVLQRRPAGIDTAEVLGDVADAELVRAAVRGHDAVLHLAAKVDVVGPWEQYQRVNVDGTRSVVRACLSAAVPRLVFVSSPSVAHAGEPLIGAAATPADPDAARSNYSRSKATAELLALAADGPDLAVLAVRPHLIWGPGDTQLVGPIVERGCAGRLPLIGGGTALIDTTYVDNAVDALVAAVDACGRVHGEALVVSNGEPRPVAEILARVCAAAGVPGPGRKVPLSVAVAAGAVVEGAWRLARRPGVPPVTRFLAEQLGTAHWFDQRRTRSALGWAPAVSLDAGFELLRQSFADIRPEPSPTRR